MYDKIPNSQLVTIPIDFWSQGDDLCNILKLDCLMSTIENYIFLTSDPLIYSNSDPKFFENIKKFKNNGNLLGFLHRLPSGLNQSKQLKERAIIFKKLFVFSKEMEKTLTNKFKLNNIIYLPHHPTHYKFIGFNKKKLKTKLRLNNYKKIFTIIGDIRDGKGIEILVKSWRHINQKDLKEIFFILAGRSTKKIINFVEINKKKYNVNCLIDLRRAKNPLDLEVLFDYEFGNYITVSDVGLFLYQGEQRMGMSGVCPNFIFYNLPVISTENSIIGKYVKDNSLGEVLSKKQENCKELAKLLVNIKNNSGETNYTLKKEFQLQRQKIKPKNILTSFKTHLC